MSTQSKKKKMDVYLHGQCLCGTIKYKVTRLESKMAHCHCSMCQKFHGAAFSTFGEALKEHFVWLDGEAKLKTYTASNGTQRQFCSECGSSLIFIPSNYSGKTVEFSLGTLDSPIPEKPDAHIYCNSKPDWDEITDTLPQYPEGRN